MDSQVVVGCNGGPTFDAVVSPWNSASLPQENRYDPISGRHILVAGDDIPLSRFLHRELSARSFALHLVHDAEGAVAALERARFDLAIIDLQTPADRGSSLLRRIQPIWPQMPVIKLTAGNRVEDRVSSLEDGADDCLSKPFSFIELLARVRCLLRRSVGLIPDTSTVADLTLSREEHRVERNGRRIDLTPREFAILEFLIRQPGRPVSRATLVEEVWKTPYDPSSNIVDVYVKYVRDKVDLPGERKLIQTIRGIGYSLSSHS